MSGASHMMCGPQAQFNKNHAQDDGDDWDVEDAAPIRKPAMMVN